MVGMRNKNNLRDYTHTECDALVHIQGLRQPRTEYLTPSYKVVEEHSSSSKVEDVKQKIFILKGRL